MGPEEVNAEERIRIQLWDSDRTSADDDLGRIELDLKELMHSPQSKGKMWDRTDGFLALEGTYNCYRSSPFGFKSRKPRVGSEPQRYLTPSTMSCKSSLYFAEDTLTPKSRRE